MPRNGINQIKSMEKMIADYNIRVILRPSPGSNGLCCKYEDGFLILIDCNLSDDARKKTLKHELIHIYLNHLENDSKTTEEKELEVEAILKMRRRII